MSNQTLNQLPSSLKHLNAPLERLGRVVDRLDMLAYKYQCVSLAHKEVIKQYKDLAEILDEFEYLAFEMRQEYTVLHERFAALRE